MSRVIGLLLLLHLGACEKATGTAEKSISEKHATPEKAAAQSDIFCFEERPGESKGINPLLTNTPHCYESESECLKASKGASCRSHGPAKWHCSPTRSANSHDPLANASTCLPTLDLCKNFQDSMRVSLEHLPAAYKIGSCTFQDEVSCSTSLVCFETHEDCQLAGEVIAAALHSQPALCTLKRSR